MSANPRRHVSGVNSHQESLRARLMVTPLGKIARVTIQNGVSIHGLYSNLHWTEAQPMSCLSRAKNNVLNPCSMRSWWHEYTQSGKHYGASEIPVPWLKGTVVPNTLVGRPVIRFLLVMTIIDAESHLTRTLHHAVRANSDYTLVRSRYLWRAGRWVDISTCRDP